LLKQAAAGESLEFEKIFIQDDSTEWLSPFSCSDRLLFVLTGAFANNGLMVGTPAAPAENSSREQLNSEQMTRLAKTVYLSKVTARYATKEKIQEALHVFRMGGSITPIFEGTSTENPPKRFEVVLNGRHSDANRTSPVKTISQEVHLLCQLFDTNMWGKLVVSDEGEYEQEPFVIGHIEKHRALSWKLQQPSSLFNEFTEAHGICVSPQQDYSHLHHMSDFGLQGKERRYACVQGIMGRQYYSVVRAAGISLLPSELFARVAVDLVFCPRDATRRLLLHPSKTWVKSVCRVAKMVLEGDSSDGEDESEDGSSDEDDKSEDGSSDEDDESEDGSSDEDDIFVFTKPKCAIPDDLSDKEDESDDDSSDEEDSECHKVERRDENTCDYDDGVGHKRSNSEKYEDESKAEEEDTTLQEDEYKFGLGKGLTVQDVASINWARQVVRKIQPICCKEHQCVCGVHIFKYLL
jgi:hypothetical protein